MAALLQAAPSLPSSRRTDAAVVSVSGTKAVREQQTVWTAPPARVSAPVTQPALWPVAVGRRAFTGFSQPHFQRPPPLA